MTDVKERVQRNEEIYNQYEEMWQAAEDEKAEQERLKNEKIRMEEEASVALRRQHEEKSKKGRKKKPRKTVVWLDNKYTNIGITIVIYNT